MCFREFGSVSAELGESRLIWFDLISISNLNESFMLTSEWSIAFREGYLFVAFATVSWNFGSIT